MYLLIPTGHSHAIISRVPWFTVCVIAICTLVQGWAHHQERLDAGAFARLETDVGQAAAAVLSLRGKPIGKRQKALDAEQRAMLDEVAGSEPRSDDPYLVVRYRHLLRVAKELGRDNLIGRLGFVDGRPGVLSAWTSAFVHGGWMHLIGNMLFLYLVGCNMEERWGLWMFGGFYLAGAIASAYAFAAWNPDDESILVGASGAIAAVMGAFLVFYARARIQFFYWLLFPWRVGFFRARASLVLPLWFLGEVGSAYFDKAGTDGVAYAAHVGGFAFGAVFAAAMAVTGLDRRLAEAHDVYLEDP